MKTKYLLISGLALAIGASAYAGVKTLNIGFGAPTVSGETNVSDPEKGAIFLDTSENPPVFKGNRGTTNNPDWAPLSATTTPSGLPPGAVIMTAATTCPEGMLEMDGSSYSRVDHASLFAAIGTTYGTEDADHFSVPNAAGVFIRGAGSQEISGVTYTGTPGTVQSDALQNITGTFGGTPQTNNFFTGAFAQGPAFSGAGTQGQPHWTVVFDASRVVRTATETRPANIALHYCIVD